MGTLSGGEGWGVDTWSTHQDVGQGMGQGMDRTKGLVFSAFCRGLGDMGRMWQCHSGPL